MAKDSVSLQEYSEKNPNDELIARGSVKTKTFRREDSTSWVARNPVNAMKRISFISMEKSPFTFFTQKSLFWEGWNTDVVNSIWCTKKQVLLYICVYISDINQAIIERAKKDLILYFFSALFSDNEKAQQILSTTYPLTLKRLGRKVTEPLCFVDEDPDFQLIQLMVTYMGET